MKKDGRLHLRHEAVLLEQVKQIATARGVTITHLVDQFFRELVAADVRPKAEEDLGVEQA